MHIVGVVPESVRRVLVSHDLRVQVDVGRGLPGFQRLVDDALNPRLYLLKMRSAELNLEYLSSHTLATFI